MKTVDIIRQLRAVLPRYTSLFNDEVNVTSLINTGGTVTVTTSSVHGLSTDDYIYISGALTPITITSLIRVGNVATAVTASNHDLTRGYQSTVTISGANQADYNGEHALLDVPNRRTFTFSVSNEPVTPATGTIKTVENIKHGYNGLHKITVIDATHLTYTITSNPESPALGTIILKKNIRISGAINLNRALESYTKQMPEKCCMFVVLGGSNASKDRYTLNDGTCTHSTGTDYRQRIIDPFSVYVVIPTIDSISAMDQRDLMEDVGYALYKSLLRLKIPKNPGEETNFAITFAGHDFAVYDYAYYVHEFRFENVYDLVYEDTIDDDDSVAFRDIYLNFESYVNPTSNEPMTAHVNLDDVPL